MFSRLFVVCSLSLFAVSVFATSVYATDTWIGNGRVIHDRRGVHYEAPLGNAPVFYNIADYDWAVIRFEYYQAGATEPGRETWRLIDAKAEVVRDSDGEVLAKGSVPIVGQNGNNVVYALELGRMHPDTVFGVVPGLENRQILAAHINVTFNGMRGLSVPVQYQYAP